MSDVQAGVRGYRYETTADGDVVTYDDNAAEGANEPAAKRSWQSRNSSSRDRSHSRNLSAHFFDATKLTEGSDAQEQIRQHFGKKQDYSSGAPTASSPAAGQKHRRMFSGDVSNPPLAHRRINSIGQASAVDRYLQRPRSHRREDSAGLDILSAAADVTGDELADAAGAGSGRPPTSWEPTHSRLSSLDFYDYGSAAATRPSVPPMKPPNLRSYPAHHTTPSYGYGPTSVAPYPPTSFYPPNPSQSSQYPMQYSQRPSQGLYKPYGDESPSNTSGQEKLSSDEKLFERKSSYGFGSGSSGPESMLPSHRKNMSSFSSIGALLGSSLFSPGQDGNDHPLKSHHRSTSSSISFLNGLDVLEGSDVNFLRNLHSTAPPYGSTTQPPMPPLQAQPQTQQPQVSFSSGIPETVAENEVSKDDTAGGQTKLATGGTSKRVRRKCTIDGCANRVVQGGLCIAHGARRKVCKHPGCTKNVKKAGFCSTHGPARKRCEAEGCSKVAVQGGHCIAHGAKKKLCSVESCQKQAILGGMCKKHHDKIGGVKAPPLQNDGVCVVIGSNGNAENTRPVHKPGHTRGLSIFQDLSADAVQNLLGEDPINI